MNEMQFDIDRLAKLARLELTDEERVVMAEQLPSIMEYIGKLQEVDTSNVDAKAYLTDAVNVFRQDEVKADAAEHDAAVESFPRKTGAALEVPGIFE